MVNKRLVRRGDVAVPVAGGAPSSIAFKNFPVLGPHLYLGKNRWFLPTGEIENGQKFHRRILLEIKRSWWKIVK